MSIASVARAHDRAEPVYLVRLTLLGSPPVVLYFAERAITVDGQEYEGYIASVEGIGQSLMRRDSGTLNSPVVVRFLNEPWGAYAHLAELMADNPFEGAAVELSETYIDARGQASAVELITRGLLEGPHEVGPMEFACRMSNLEALADRR